MYSYYIKNHSLCTKLHILQKSSRLTLKNVHYKESSHLMQMKSTFIKEFTFLSRNLHLKKKFTFFSKKFPFYKKVHSFHKNLRFIKKSPFFSPKFSCYEKNLTDNRQKLSFYIKKRHLMNNKP